MKSIFLVVALVMLVVVCSVPVLAAEKVYPRNPSGTYNDLVPTDKSGLEGPLGMKTVVNRDNSRYPTDSISVKLEFHNKQWGHRAVIRNPTSNPEAILSPALKEEVAKYASEIRPKMEGQGGKEGDATLERTWVVKDGTFSILRK